MKPTPLFITACAVAAIGGAVGGAAIDTTPIQRAGVGLPEFMRSASFDPSDEGFEQPLLPDHYPIVTPSGRVEVAELAANGLYAPQRLDWPEARYVAVSAPRFDEPASEDWSRALPSEVAAGTDASPGPGAETPKQLGEARTIDVAVELARPS